MNVWKEENASYFRLAEATLRGVAKQASTVYSPQSYHFKSTRPKISWSEDSDSIRLLAAALKASPSQHCAIVNAANSKWACGGVKHGANAQEEALCRHTTLSARLDYDRTLPRRYPLNMHDLSTQATKVLATAGVKFIVPIFDILRQCPKETESFVDRCIVRDFMTKKNETHRFGIAGPDFTVISLAAPNRAKLELDPKELLPKVHEAMTIRFRLMWLAAKEQGVRTLILPIPGCGSFARFPDRSDRDPEFIHSILQALVDSLPDSDPSMNVIIPNQGELVKGLFPTDILAK